MKILKEEIKTWGALPHAAPQTHRVFNCLMLFSARGSRGVWRLIKARRSTGSTVFKVWRGGILAHALRVLLCLHLPVCINQTIIHLLCWREGLMKMGFSSSFLCYDMLLLGVEGLCGERNVRWEIFIFLYIYWADQMLWKRHGCFVRLKQKMAKREYCCK